MIEKYLEQYLFACRWFIAPFYALLATSVLLLLVKFVQEFAHFTLNFLSFTDTAAILGLLSLIDLTLMANLLVIVVFSGYESFVSKIDGADGKNRPEWMGKIDFSGLKQKLITSIVAISAIQLLKAFMNVDTMSDTKLAWLVGLHLTFVASGVLLALMDRLTMQTHSSASRNGT